MTTRTYGWVVAIAALGLLLAYGCQYMVVRPARGSASAPECSAVSLLSAMRERLRPEADFSESGGIYLDSVDPEDPEALIAYAALGRFCQEPAGRRTDEGQALARRLARIASSFIVGGRLEPGRYVLTAATDGSRGDEVVAVSPEHLALLRSMNTRTLGRAVMLMDSKRPYGDMHYFYIDMARALGEPVPLDANGNATFAPGVIARYDELHGQMLDVVRVFWRFAEPVQSAS